MANARAGSLRVIGPTWRLAGGHDRRPDYTEDALAAAHAELARRGHDVASLVAATEKPLDRAAERSRLGGGLVLAGIVIAMFGSPFIGGAPSWMQVAFSSGVLALCSVGIASLVRRP